jgi:hypothetical protein
LHMHGPPTSQSHGCFLKENNCFWYFFILDQTRRLLLSLLL